MITPNSAPPPVKPVILSVEDDPIVQALIGATLKAHNFEMFSVGSGEAALSWLNTARADLILLDVGLPGQDGIEVCRQIRKQHPASLLPVIMLSASGDNADERVRGLQAGANDYVAKPFHVPELVARIQNALRIKADADSAESLLSRYIPRGLRKRAALDPTLLERHEKGHAVILFADLRGFTRLAANAHTLSVIKVLDEYFEAMMQVIEDHGGVLFDVTGDQLLAVFNLPYPLPLAGYLSVQAAIEMQRLFRYLQRAWLKVDLKVGLGIGIHQGEVMLGNLGAGGLQRYTVVGNVVNLASRYLGLALDGEIVVSPEIYAEYITSPTPANVTVTETSNVAIKGIDTPQQVYCLRPVFD